MTTDHLTDAQRKIGALFLEGQGWGFGGSVDINPNGPGTSRPLRLGRGLRHVGAHRAGPGRGGDPAHPGRRGQPGAQHAVPGLLGVRGAGPDAHTTAGPGRECVARPPAGAAGKTGAAARTDGSAAPTDTQREASTVTGPRVMLRVCGAAFSASWWWSRACARCRVGRNTRAACWPRCCATAGRPLAVAELVDARVGRRAADGRHDGARRRRPPSARAAGPGLVGHHREGGYGSGRRPCGRRGVRRVAGRGLARLGGATVARTSTAALALWRGPAYAGIGRPFARDEAARLEELRRRCVERLADAELALGCPNRVVAQLAELVAANPTRERAAAQLMLALHATRPAGRRAGRLPQGARDARRGARRGARPGAARGRGSGAGWAGRSPEARGRAPLGR